MAGTPDHLDGVRLGLAAGHDVALGARVTLGAEAGIGWDLGERKRLGTANASYSLHAGHDLDASLRFGYRLAPRRAAPRTLIYAKAGYANSRFRFQAKSGNTVTMVQDDEDGWRIGAGVEQKLSGRTYLKAEYGYTDYGDDVHRHQLLLGAGLRF